MLFTLTQMEIYKLFVPLLFFILKMSTYLADFPPPPLNLVTNCYMLHCTCKLMCSLYVI